MKNRLSSYLAAAFAFVFGQALVGLVPTTYDLWGRLRGDVPSPSDVAIYFFTETMIFVLVIGSVSAISYVAGAGVRSLRRGSLDRLGAGRAALTGAGFCASLFLFAYAASLADPRR